MLYMSVFTYKPENREAVIKKRLEIGLSAPGVKVIGQWSYVGMGQVWTLSDADDSLAAYKSMAPYGALGKFEIFPVIETDQLMKALAAK